MDVVVGLALMLGTPAYVVLQIIGLATSGYGRWGLAFAAPLLLSLPIAAWCLCALSQDSNLWPLPFILFAPVGCLYLGALFLARRLAAPIA